MKNAPLRGASLRGALYYRTSRTSRTAQRTLRRYVHSANPAGARWHPFGCLTDEHTLVYDYPHASPLPIRARCFPLADRSDVVVCGISRTGQMPPCHKTLVLMEYGLRASEVPECLSIQNSVLILVLMEYGLREVFSCPQRKGSTKVLILVLMEYGLRGSNL